MSNKIEIVVDATEMQKVIADVIVSMDANNYGIAREKMILLLTDLLEKEKSND